MEIERLNALSDNYIFLLYDRAQKIAAVVDPAEPEPVFRRLEALQVDLVDLCPPIEPYQVTKNQKNHKTFLLLEI